MDDLLAKKLVASTVSSRRTRAQNQGQEDTRVALNTHRKKNATAEGGQERGQGGGRRPLSCVHGDAPMCILHRRAKKRLQQHDSRPTAHEYDACNPTTPRPHSQLKEKDISKVEQEARRGREDTGSSSKEKHNRCSAKKKHFKKTETEQEFALVVIQKNVWSLKTSDRVEEFFFLKKRSRGCK